MMMKKIIFSLIVLVLSISLFAQNRLNDQRTLETKIADLLMKLPPRSSADQEKIMAELVALGEPAVSGIAATLVAPGKGDDAAARYAISGLVKYIAKGNDPNQMKSYSQSILKALVKAQDDEVKDFLLQELQYVAGDEVVEGVCSYLYNERLCDPAARVLVRVNSESSGKALTEALAQAGITQQTILVKALGQLRYQPAAGKIGVLATTTVPMLKKTVLRALAEMGDVSFATLLAIEAEKARYSYESTDATGSYLLFLQRVAENGFQTFANKSCKKIVKTDGIPNQAKSVALQILTRSSGEKAVPDLLKALKSNDKDFRVAAENLLGTLYSPQVSGSLKKMASSSKNTGLQSELLYLMSQKSDKSALPLMLQMLASSDKEVQLAAITASAKTGKEEAVTPLVSLIKTGDPEIVSAAKTALLTIGGESVADAAASAIPQVSGAARCALIGIIAKRQASRYGDLIFAETANTDPQVRLAAVKALSSLVKRGEEERIARLLNQVSDEGEIGALQDALFQCIQYTEKKEDQISAILSLMQKAGDKQSRYYAILSEIGTARALPVVEKVFETGSSEQKEAALKALAGWSDFSALDALFRISKNNPSGKFHEVALASYVAGINKTEVPADQKVLMFRNAMELADHVDQKKQILRGISKNSTLPSLVFVSQYLDNEGLQQTAIQAIHTMLPANPGLWGSVVREIADKAMSLNKDEEAGYQKQALLKHLATLPQEIGFVALFNGKDLTGWKGLVENPITRAKMSTKALAEAQGKADKEASANWVVENGTLVFTGKGDNLCTARDYGDFEMVVDWKLYPGKEPDAGIYLRGTPQVQIWDTSRVNVGAQVGSGGLYNNQKNRSKPSTVADNQVDEWNTFYIKMVGDKVTVTLNGQLVTDNVILENYWDRNQTIFPAGQIELQAHGSKVAYRDIYIREIPQPKPYTVSNEEEKEGFVPLFNGTDMAGWMGNLTDYFAQEGMIVCQPSGTGSGNLYTSSEYSNFIMRFEFQLTPGANNGLGIRTPTEGDAAYVGMELQILDNEAAIYKNLQPYQYHGSVYGVIPARRGFQKPVGEWNYQEVQALGNRIKVILNGEIILDGDIKEASKNGTETADHRNHPGLLNPSGHIGFLGHGSPLKFRNLRIKEVK
jgi:HEAT repeat protein